MELLAFVPLAFMIRSDYKERVISIYPLLFFGILTVTGSVWRWGWEESVVRVVGGVGVLAFLMGGVLLYLLLKYRRRINPFREYIGTGDGVFLLCLTPSFQLMEFVRFLIIAFALTLMTWILGLYKNKSKRGIPLVSTVGVCYACYLVYCFICN